MSLLVKRMIKAKDVLKLQQKSMSLQKTMEQRYLKQQHRRRLCQLVIMRQRHQLATSNCVLCPPQRSICNQCQQNSSTDNGEQQPWQPPLKMAPVPE